MIEALNAILPIIIYFLLILLLIVVIVLGIKFIITIDRINSIIEDVQEKVESLNTIFKVATKTADKVSYFGSKVVDSVIGMLNKVLGVKNRKDDDEDYE